MKTSLFLLPLAALSLSACGYSVFDAAEDMSGSSSDDNGLADGTAITGNKATVAAFTELTASGPDNIVFVTGDSFSISATGDAEAIKNLRYRVKDGKLRIGRVKEKVFGSGRKGVTITVTAPRLSDASLAGSGSVSVGSITAKSLESNLAGSGDVVFGGKVDRAEYSIAGSGNIDAVKMASTDAEVSIAGSGNVKLTATGKVDASIAGSGSIDVTGGAKCTSSKVGSGKISCG